MSDLISFHEMKLRRAIEEAMNTLVTARMLVSEGKDVPENLISRIEEVIANLEQQLIDHIEKDGE